MLNYDWNFTRVVFFLDALWSGAWFSIQLSLATIAFSTILGCIWGVCIARSRIVLITTLPFLDVLRALPPLVILLFGYYFYTEDVLGGTLPAFWVFVFSVGLNISAFIADLTRAGISNVAREYVLIGEAMGLSQVQLLKRVTLPLAAREVLPPLGYLYIETIKLTSLASVVAVQETVYVAQNIIVQTSRSLEVWLVVGAIYVALTLPASFLVRKLEVRQKKAAGLIR